MATWNSRREEKRLEGIQEHLRHDLEVNEAFPGGKRIIREKEKREIVFERATSIDTKINIERQQSEINVPVFIGTILATIVILVVLF